MSRGQPGRAGGMFLPGPFPARHFPVASPRGTAGPDQLAHCPAACLRSGPARWASSPRRPRYMVVPGSVPQHVMVPDVGLAWGRGQAQLPRRQVVPQQPERGWSRPPPRRPPLLTHRKLLAAVGTAVAPHGASQMHRPRHCRSGPGGRELTVYRGCWERLVLRQTFSSAPESPGKTPRSREPSQGGSVSGFPLDFWSASYPWGLGGLPWPLGHPTGWQDSASRVAPGESSRVHGDKRVPGQSPREPLLSLLLGLLARVPSGLCQWVGKKA